MAGKKSLQLFEMFALPGGDISASVISQVTNVQFEDNIGIQVSWTGTSPVGTLAIECSNDYGRNGVTSPVWVALDFGSTINITGNSGSHTININQLPFTNIRANYTRVSGTGTLKAQISAKSLG